MFKSVIIAVIMSLFFSVQSKIGNPTKGIATDCILGESWNDGCNNFTCSKNGPMVVNKDKIIGCKSKCYKPGTQVQLDLCSMVECGTNNKFKVVKLGCLEGKDCKTKGQKWPVSRDGDCKTMKCMVNFRKSRYTTKTTESTSSKYCKEIFSAECHKKKVIWYEYFPAKGEKGSGKCQQIQCTRKGPKTLKKSKACTHKDKCVLNGRKAPRISSDQQICECQDGRMICLNSTPET